MSGTNDKDEELVSLSSLCNIRKLIWTKDAYKAIGKEFHSFHRHDMNVFLHLLTTGLGVWGAIQLATSMEEERNRMQMVVYGYMGWVVLTSASIVTSVIHTGMIVAFEQISITSVIPWVSSISTWILNQVLVQWNIDLTVYLTSYQWTCIVSILLGYTLQDVAHYLCEERTYLNDYIWTRPYMLLFHTVWLLPLVIDAMSIRYWFVPYLFVYRNRNVVCTVASRSAVEQLRQWINEHVDTTPVTTHIWPHREPGTTKQVSALEQDASIYAGFRQVFPKHHYDIVPVQDMNEIYITAVGAKKEINSDAVFYTKHNDGPFWFLPFASLYRVLVAVTPNQMVRTNFTLQHESQSVVLDMYQVCGFDYNRELHFIDHVPGTSNTERRSLIKLHFCVYPKGWHTYGTICRKLNTMYNTWARGNFLQTLQTNSLYDFLLAWWIWLTTFANATVEQYIGWPNVVYILTSYTLGILLEQKGYTSLTFCILTSFRHYFMYIMTFAFRQPMVAHGFFMRDALLYKTLALTQLASRIVPLLQFQPSDNNNQNTTPTATTTTTSTILMENTMSVLGILIGYTITMMATARLGMVRTYFGSELGFVKPKWITGFPYGTIPHPMIVGQLIVFTNVLYWWSYRMTIQTKGIVIAHAVLYTVHMIQEIFTSSY